MKDRKREQGDPGPTMRTTFEIWDYLEIGGQGKDTSEMRSNDLGKRNLCLKVPYVDP